MPLKFLLPLFLLVLPRITEGAGDAALDRATLRGLTSLSVVIDRLDPDIERQGLTQSALQSRLEGRLESAGIKIEKGTENFVGLRIVQVRGSRGPYALCLSVGVYQPVLLVRDRNVKTATQTWEVETVLMADPKLVYRAAVSSVDELAEQFLAAYRSVNPQ